MSQTLARVLLSGTAFGRVRNDSCVLMGKSMEIERVRCSVADAMVTRVVDLEGATVRVICSEYRESDHTCRLKRVALDGGPLSRLLERASEGTLNSRSAGCALL